MSSRPSLCAVLWDFDGTLVDTRARNMSVNRRIVGEITGRHWSDFPVMRSQEAYDNAQRAAANWREFYRLHCGLDDDAIDRAGSRWSGYQLDDRTPAPLFAGVGDALGGLDGLPRAIVSQNDRRTIEALLADHGLGDRFHCIVGYAEVAMARQKPAPDGLLAALERLSGLIPGVALFVGDHETDARCASNANRELAERGCELRVRSVAALWGPDASDRDWSVRPDFRAAAPADVVTLAAELSRR